jgi:hypothetical protein
VQGAVVQDKMAMAHEKPAHRVHVDSFFIDIHEVTNAHLPSWLMRQDMLPLPNGKLIGRR